MWDGALCRGPGQTKNLNSSGIFTAHFLFVTYGMIVETVKYGLLLIFLDQQIIPWQVIVGSTYMHMRR